MLSEREFNLMKPGVRIVNIARGPLIDEEALIAAMEKGKVIGVGWMFMRMSRMYIRG